MEEKKPAVIGVGGLLEREECGRIQNMLEILKENGCVIYSARFRTICRDGNTIICPISTEWTEDINLVVNETIKDERVDTKRIGIIASSLGATFMDYFIAKNPALAEGLNPYVALVPFARPHPAIKPHIQKMIDGKVDMDVSFQHDREKGITRKIPSHCLQTVLDVDTPSVLSKRSIAYNISPLTILGLKDDRCDNSAAKERHEILNGKPENLIELDYGHSIPQEAVQEKVIQFITKGLGIN